MADALSPTSALDGQHSFFLASTELALASGWTNNSVMTADPTYGAYAAVLTTLASSPFAPQSDGEQTQAPADQHDSDDKMPPLEVKIDVDGLQRRIVALPLPAADFRFALAGPAGSACLAEA